MPKDHLKKGNTHTRQSYLIEAKYYTQKQRILFKDCFNFMIEMDKTTSQKTTLGQLIEAEYCFELTFYSHKVF